MPLCDGSLGMVKRCCGGSSYAEGNAPLALVFKDIYAPFRGLFFLGINIPLGGAVLFPKNKGKVDIRVC